MALQTMRTMTIDDVPPMRRSCEHPDHPRHERVPVTAFIISLTSRNAALRGGLYVCEEHAEVNAKFLAARVVASPVAAAAIVQCAECLAVDGGHTEACGRREPTVSPVQPWTVRDAARLARSGLR